MSKLSDVLNSKNKKEPQIGFTLNNEIKKEIKKADIVDPLASLFTKPAAIKTENNNPLLSADSLMSAEIILTTDIGEWKERELNSDAPELEQALQSHLIHLKDALKEGDVATALYDTKAFLDNNPATKVLLLPEDINLFVKSLQSSHSIVIAKKATRKATKSVTNTKATELAAELTDLGL